MKSTKSEVVEIVLCSPNAKIPTRGTDESGGWDLYVSEIEQVQERQVVCKLGIKMKPPSNYKITIVPRSSITKTGWIIQNSPCLGDPDYRGEYIIKYTLVNETTEARDIFPFCVGDRVAQMYLEEIIPIEFLTVDELNQTGRGENGFGSTGK